MNLSPIFSHISSVGLEGQRSSLQASDSMARKLLGHHLSLIMEPVFQNLVEGFSGDGDGVAASPLIAHLFPSVLAEVLLESGAFQDVIKKMEEDER